MEDGSGQPAGRALQAASLIAGAEPPAGLPDLLLVLAGSLKTATLVQTKFPSRAKLIARLETIKSAADALALELGDNFSFRGSVEADAAVLAMQAAGLDAESIDRLSILPELMSKVAISAQRAVDAIPRGQGRHKAMPNAGAPTPHIMCASIVSYCWNKIHDALPSPGSEVAQAACEAIWNLAGLDRVRFGNNLTGWRGHLETVGGSDLRELKGLGWYWHTLKQLDVSLNPPKSGI